MQINTKFLLKKGKFYKKLYYLIEIIRFIRSRLIKNFKKFFKINEISQKKILNFYKKNKFIKENYQGLFLELKNKRKKSIAIVVPCYMHEDYIETMFKSIISQTRQPDEVIFINDNSKDSTELILLEQINLFLNNEKIKFKIINNIKNLGQSESINIGIESASSDLIMILNDDDYLFHDAIEVILSLFEKNNNLFLIGSTCIEFDNDDFLETCNKYILFGRNIESINLRIHYPEEVFNYKNFNDLNMAHSSCTFYKIAWEKAGKYISNKRRRLVPFSDRDFQLRINILFPIGVSYDIPFVFWRNNSSVDLGKYT